jgi:membrane protease YdiL (CAAX protease family)
MLNTKQSYLFLLLTLLLSTPFYVWGAVAPVDGLPLGLPISFLMIFVPLTLSLIFAWRNGIRISSLFSRIFDFKQAPLWAGLFAIFCMPVVVTASFFLMRLFSIPLPETLTFPINEIPLMILLYFIGAIPEEFGWTLMLSKGFAKSYGVVIAGIIIGSVWALWHVIPWSWAHPTSWIIGMIFMDILIRIGMIYCFVNGGESLFYSLIFHMMINISLDFFPNYGSHANPLVMSVVLLPILLLLGRIRKVSA